MLDFFSNVFFIENSEWQYNDEGREENIERG